MKPSTRTRVRSTVAVVLAVLWVVGVFLAGAFLTFPSERLGWLWAALAYGVGLVALALVLDVAPRVAVGGAVGLALVLGLLDWHSSPPTHDRIRAVAERTEMPAAWELAHESDRGSTWCFKGCPTVERSYAVPDDYPDARDEAVARLEAAGWDAGSAGPGDYVTLSDGRWTVVVGTGWSADEETVVRLSFTG